MKALLVAFLCEIAALAQNPVPLNLTQTFGMVGVALNQTARLNVVNAAAQSTGPVILPVCNLTLQLFDDQANKLGELAVDNLEPGKAVHVDLARPAPPPNVTGPARIQVRGVLIAGGPIGPQPLDVPAFPVVLPLCALVPTLEVFDNDTGKTQVVLTNAVTVITEPIPTAASRSRATRLSRIPQAPAGPVQP